MGAGGGAEKAQRKTKAWADRNTQKTEKQWNSYIIPALGF